MTISTNQWHSLTKPVLLYSRSAVLTKPCPVPQERGLYAWFFKEVPPGVPTDECVISNGLTLLYVGISPKNENSTQNLRKRIKYHYQGNAYGSTLRLTLGTLLAEQSGFPLRRVGRGKRVTFTHLGEQWLDNWMEENALVCWVEHHAPWEVETEIFETVSLPLNIKDNKHHLFADTLSDIRTKAKQEAREMPVANEGNQKRRKATTDKQGNVATHSKFLILANQGDAKAQNFLGVMYEKGEGVVQDFKEAAKWYRKSADQGNANAQVNLGWIYAKGLGVGQDYKKAIRLYRKSANQGYAKAQYNLGVMYDSGEGIIQDYKEAAKWYRKAANQGIVNAQTGIGEMYANGHGVVQDYVRAYMWLNIGAKNGDDSAQKSRDLLEKRMTPRHISKAQKLAREWMLKHQK